MNGLQTAFAEYGMGIVFFLALIEGPMVVLGTTALARMSMIDIRWVWVIGLLADLVGDVLLYSVGRFLPGALPASWRPTVAQDKVAKLFLESGARLLLVAKLTHFAGLPTLVSAGFGKMPFGPFLLWSLAGTVVKVTAIVLTGWFFWQTVLSGETAHAVAVLLGLGLCCGLGFLFYRSCRWN